MFSGLPAEDKASSHGDDYNDSYADDFHPRYYARMSETLEAVKYLNHYAYIPTCRFQKRKEKIGIEIGFFKTN